MGLVTNPDDLRKPCRPVSKSRGLETGRKLLNFLLRFNKKSEKIKGVGLAAPQLGILEKVCVLIYPQQIVLVNPTIVRHSRVQLPFKEGCLSLPGLEIDTYRYSWVEVECDNMKGVIRFGNHSLLESVIAQHEIDHLEGILIDDRKKDLTEQYEGFRLGMTNQDGNSRKNLMLENQKE